MVVEDRQGLAGSAKGGGFGEGGMMALMNLVLNEMQKGGKYYFQT